MEEKRPGQRPEADRAADEPLQGRSARAGGKAKGGLAPTDQDGALARGGEARAAAAKRDMKAHGFGDDKGADIG